MYLIIRDRWTLNRVNFGLFFAMVTVLCLLLLDGDIKLPKINSVISLCLAVLFLLSNYTTTVLSGIKGETVSDIARYKAVLSEINADSEKYILQTYPQ